MLLPPVVLFPAFATLPVATLFADRGLDVLAAVVFFVVDVVVVVVVLVVAGRAFLGLELELESVEERGFRGAL